MQVYKNNVFWFETSENYGQILERPDVQAFNDECRSNNHIMSCYVDNQIMYLAEE